MRSKDPNKLAITVRLDAALVERLRTFCRDQAGKPLYASVNGIVAQAVERELNRLDLDLSGALPQDHTGRRLDEEPTPRRTLNNHR